MSEPLNASEIAALTAFACSAIDVAELTSALAGKLVIVTQPGMREVRCDFPALDPAVEITREDIATATRKRAAGQRTQDDLSLWAAVILMIDAYDWSGSPDEDAIADELNDLSGSGLRSHAN